MELLSADVGALLLDEVARLDAAFDFENTLEPTPELGSVTEGEVCRFFLRGGCVRGAACPQKHTKSDRTVVCKHWLRGLCKKGDVCEFLHEYDLTRMPICFFFSKYGECSNADCTYRHLAGDEGGRDCPWFDRGFCKHGHGCRGRHVRRIACENYLLGFCPEGASCKFGHPKFEAPKDDPERRPGGPGGVRFTCHRCGEQGHRAAECPRATGPPTDLVCYRCGTPGHYANHCPNAMHNQHQQQPHQQQQQQHMQQMQMQQMQMMQMMHGQMPR